MNSIKVWGINKECDTYDISIETSESVSPAMLHTTARLMEGLGCTVIHNLSINDEGADDEQWETILGRQDLQRDGRTMSYKARTFTREEFRKVIAAAIYDYEHAPAKCLYTTKDAADQLYGEYGEEIEVEG